MLRPEDFFHLEGFIHRDLFQDLQYVWDALKGLKSYIGETINPNVAPLRKEGMVMSKTCVLWQGEIYDEDFRIEDGDVTKGALKVYRNGNDLEGASVLYAGSVLFDDTISIGKGSVIEPGALIKGPTIIGNHTEVRQGAYVRGSCLVGDRCVVGHTTEMKSAVMLNDAKAGHFAYIGDSILGNDVNLGAGTKLANLKMIDPEVKLRIEGKIYKTGLRKFGAIMGDSCETGCNSVTSPGILLGKESIVYPNVNVRGGYYADRSVVSTRTKGILTVRSYSRK